MSKFKKYLTLLSLALFVFSNVNAQPKEASQAPVFSGTIEEQFDILIKNSYPYENFKVVRDNLPRFKKNTIDSITRLQKQLTEQINQVDQQESVIDSLGVSLAQAKEAVAQKDNISFLGISLAKGIYNTIVWSLIIVLALLLLFFINRYKSNIRVAKESKDTADEIREEFEQHRKKSMEREQKLKRDLQDELNRSGR